MLGEFNLEGIPPQPRGVPQIEVRFDIDQNGILNVSASDKKTAKEASVVLNDSAGLDESEIDKMRQDAEQNAEDDKRQFELAEARNQAEHMCYQLEKQMSENEDKLTESDKEPLESAIERTREVAKGEDAPAIKTAVSELQQAEKAFSKILYDRVQDAPDEAAEEAGADSVEADDDAIDAEFEVKND